MSPAPSNLLALVTSALLLAGCSSAGGTTTAADPPTSATATLAPTTRATSAPTSAAATRGEASSPADFATPLDGVWVTGPVSRQRIEAVFARAGLTKYLPQVMPEVVTLPARISMTIANGQESLQMIAAGEEPASFDHESVEVSGQQLTIAPVRDGATGHSIYDWSLVGDSLSLRLIGTTEPRYEGIPAETWQRLLYTSGVFRRQ